MKRMPHFLTFPVTAGLLVVGVTLAGHGCGDTSSFDQIVAGQPGATPTASASPLQQQVNVSIPQGATGRGTQAYGANPLVVQRGTTVVWTNDDTAPHTVTADDGSFDSGTLQTGQTYSRTFDQVGTYPYYCTIHGKASMSGTVQVTEAQPSPSPSVSPGATPTPLASASASPSPTASPGTAGGMGYMDAHSH